MIDIKLVDRTVIFAGLAGAIVWNIITWYFGLPTSSSHALIGGYAGSAVAKAGLGVIIVSGWTKTLIFIVLSPIIGMILGFILMGLTLWVVRRCRRAAWTTNSGSCSLFPPPLTVSVMERTTHRRRWASLPAFCSHPG